MCRCLLSPPPSKGLKSAVIAAESVLIVAHVKVNNEEVMKSKTSFIYQIFYVPGLLLFINGRK